MQKKFLYWESSCQDLVKFGLDLQVFIKCVKFVYSGDWKLVGIGWIFELI